LVDQPPVVSAHARRRGGKPRQSAERIFREAAMSLLLFWIIGHAQFVPWADLGKVAILSAAMLPAVILCRMRG
jgi:hypothetical protein